MTDLEQRLRVEFDRQAAAAPTAAATERFALTLLDSHRYRRVRWLIPAVAALVLIVPILTVLLVLRHKTVPPVQPSVPADLVGVDWMLAASVDADGTRHPAGPEVQTLQFDGKGGVAYSVDCNDAQGKATISARTLGISDVLVSAVGCGIAPGPMNLFTDGLSSTTAVNTFRWNIVAGTLTITAADGRALIFGAPLTDLKVLLGVTWLLTQSVAADGTTRTAPAGSRPQSLQFDSKGGISFTWGCHGASGKVSITAGRLKTTALSVSTVLCVPQWGDEMALLSSTTATLSWQVDDYELTIRGSDGRQLLFRAQPA